MLKDPNLEGNSFWYSWTDTDTVERTTTLQSDLRYKPTYSMSRVDEWIEAKAETITIDNPVKTSGFTRYGDDALSWYFTLSYQVVIQKWVWVC